MDHDNRTMFGFKIAGQDEMKLVGNTDGVKWRTTVGCYFISVAPVLMNITRWAETMDHE